MDEARGSSRVLLLSSTCDHELREKVRTLLQQCSNENQIILLGQFERVVSHGCILCNNFWSR